MCEIKIKPYSGHIEKLKEPIKLKGRVIKYKPIAKLSGKESKKMRGGLGEKCFHYRKNNGDTEFTILRINPTDVINGKKINDIEILREFPIVPPSQQTKNANKIQKKEEYKKFLVTFATNNWVVLGKNEGVVIIDKEVDPESLEEFAMVEKQGMKGWVNLKYLLNSEQKGPCIQKKNNLQL